MIWLSLCLLLVYRNACDFYTLMLCPETLLNLLISLTRFGAETMGFSKYTIISSVNSDSLTFSLLIWMPFISFRHLIALARTSRKLLDLINEFNKISGYKISVHKSVALLYTTNNQVRNQIKN